MENTLNQTATQEKPIQKKQWIEPKIEIINHGYIASGIHTNGTEANYAGSPFQLNYFAS